MTFNVKSFGAKADGLTDDTNAIKSAFNQMPSGGTLFFPAAQNYRISEPIIINKPCTITGNKSLLSSLTSDIFIVNADNVSITGIDFICDTSNYFKDRTFIKATGKNFVFANNRIKGIQHSGVKLEGTTNAKIINNDFKDCAYMVYCSNTAVTSIQNNYFTGGRTHYSSGETTVGDGVKLTGDYNREIIINGNFFEGIYRDAIDMFRGGFNVIISNNVMKDIDILGLDIKTIYRNPEDPNGTSTEENKSREYTITGNRFYNCGTTPDGAAISITHSEHRTGLTRDYKRGVESVLISNNYIDKTSRLGIVLESCFDISIRGNTIKKVPGKAIPLLGECRNIRISNNDIDASGSNDAVIAPNTLCSNITITGNSINRSDTTIYSGIFLEGDYLEVLNNTVKNFAVGISSSLGKRHHLNGNNLYNCSTAGISTGGSTTSPIESIYQANVIHDSSRAFFFRSADGKNLVVMNNVSVKCSTNYSNSSSIEASKFINNQVIA
ncbi:right-handed parallel beta-helix repeat-containing protein [Planococcus maritimus]|uniref:right-handed parallel beta-helix repeat-containing protein n=1 Tax=Planococcus maritimus TaxID=192421 RepID=UPI000793BE97|nr:glycosyl hydrolase family 28-related protein [Planococcus maritimus]KYG59407.1 hypothetical protein AY633_03950 [Planococcus maritimus]